jgi:hypothetical protein
MKRQRGRNRGGGGGKPQQNANRAFDSNGPEGIKVRGNAQHVFEKYQQLARDATSSGDRVLAENYLQHAEHYFRLLRAIQPQRSASEILGRDQFASGYDIDFEDEGAAQAAEAADEAAEVADDGDGREARERGGWQERPRDDRRDDRQDGRRDDRPRDERRDRRDRWRDRDDRPRDERAREDRSREDRSRDDRSRDDRSRDERARDERRDERPRDRDDRRDRYERHDREERDPLAVVEPQAAAPFGGSEERGSPMLRDAEGGESHAPAFLQAPPRREGDDEAAPARRPRRRRAPRNPEADQGGASNEAEEA